LHVADQLGRGPDRGVNGRGTDLAAMLRLAATTARRRGVIVVISDFISDADWEPELTRLGQRHEVVCVRVVDPAELELPDVGLVLVEDAETGEQLLADTGDPVFRRRLAQQVAAREETLTDAMRRAGVLAQRVDTRQDTTVALIDLVRATHRRRR
jgi:hypothetical protein